MRHATAAILLAAMFSLPCIADEGGAAKPGKGAAGEFAKNQELKQQLLARFDLNKDGVLSNEEKLRMQNAGGLGPAAFPAAAEEFLRKFDQNRDGKLSDAEKMAGMAALQRLRAQGGAGGFGNGVGNGLGNVAGDVPQSNPLNAQQGKPKPEKVSALVKRFDKDGDGKLNAEEKAAAQAELRKSKADKAKTRPKTEKKEKEPAEPK